MYIFIHFLTPFSNIEETSLNFQKYLILIIIRKSNNFVENPLLSTYLSITQTKKSEAGRVVTCKWAFPLEK